MADLVPDSLQMARACEIYLANAYSDGDVPQAASLDIPLQEDLFDWLLSGVAELNPPDVTLAQVRRFAIRLGNQRYPYMKLTLSRHTRSTRDTRVARNNASKDQNDYDSARSGPWIFAVDSHDLMLHGQEDRPQEAIAIDQLKEYNRQIANKIQKQWEAVGIMTEHAWLRRQIAQFDKS